MLALEAPSCSTIGLGPPPSGRRSEPSTARRCTCGWIGHGGWRTTLAHARPTPRSHPAVDTTPGGVAEVVRPVEGGVVRALIGHSFELRQPVADVLARLVVLFGEGDRRVAAEVLVEEARAREPHPVAVVDRLRAPAAVGAVS
eukprot:6766071-Prymnesium_polylepis.1